MEEATWEQKLQALTHILTHHTTSPSLHSQLLFSSLIPCYAHSDYPPVLCSKPTLHLTWAFTHFLRRISPPRTSWRCKCPYQQPPPLILAKGLEAASWEDEERRREYVRMRTSRRPLRSKVNPMVPFLVPNLMLLSLLLWNPFPEYD
uniref:Transmembrane protein n=1 Tax=Kalanchoe fedtschenkoi TaxID=63787 RepID=A0A7N0UY33_KALFE